MHSRRSELYTTIGVLLFLKEHSNFYSIPLQNKFSIYCDNKEIVNKTSMIKTTANYYNLNYTMSEHEAIVAIKSYLPQRYEIFNLYIHQTIQSGTTKLNVPQKLNELADTVVKKFTKISLNINIPFAPIDLYFNNTYIPNICQHHIYRLVFQNVANGFIKKKEKLERKDVKKY